MLVFCVLGLILSLERSVRRQVEGLRTNHDSLSTSLTGIQRVNFEALAAQHGRARVLDERVRLLEQQNAGSIETCAHVAEDFRLLAERLSGASEALFGAAGTAR